ncbi:centrosomal protein of 164 kDa isoform X2 [Elgaria multicarinata webbii]|uniref:centrosomal protein of 164 kDa isoform X2 n=1 Tax=Elgaria multicarinata webbii TaxID=159646 RepID=UPI002FCD0926
MAMAGPAIRIGDQLILEEDYDETYMPSEQEIHEFARVIGIDPENEPELMWLAREGIVARLPAEWKPCQDITGDIYYFNFANGQSTWDHPCDERYRQLVVQEREKLLDQEGLKKKDKKKKKEKKKEKRASELLKRPGEVQSEPGIVPSTSFYKVSSPVLSSGHVSPDLEQQGSLITRNEPFLKTHTGGKASGMPGLLSGPAPAKLQPLGPAKPSRSRQILADVEKILGRASSSNRLDSALQSRQDVTAEIRCAAAAHAFSDSEPEDLDSISVAKPLFQTLKEPSQAVENAKMVVVLGTPKERSLFSEGEKLGKDKGGRQVEGQPPVHLSPGEGAVGTVCPVPDPQLQVFSVLGAVAGTSGDASPLLAGAAVPVQPRDEKKQGARPDGGGGSSVTSSLADHLASQILGEVDNFSWDLQSSRESDHPTEHLAASKRPFLEALHTPQTQSSPDERSESECYSEDQKFYQHVLHMVKRSRGAELSEPKPLKQRQGGTKEPGTGQDGEPDVTRYGAMAVEARPSQGAAGFQTGRLQSPGEGQGGSIENGQAEGEPVQSGAQAQNDSGPELSPAGDRGKESPGPALAPPQAALGSLAPLRGFVDAPAAALCDTRSRNGRSFVEPKAPAQTWAMPDSCRKSLFESMDDDGGGGGDEEEAVAAASLNQLILDGAEKEEGSNESPCGTAGLLKNLHVGVSALSASFDNEASEGSSHLKEWHISDPLDPEPQDTQRPVLENVLDVAALSPVLDSPNFGVSRAAVESTRKEEDPGWLAQEKDTSKGSLEEEQSQGSAEATKRERSKRCPSASETAEEMAAVADAHALQAKKTRAAQQQRNLDEQEPPCPENCEVEVKQTELFKMHAGDSLEEMSKAKHTSLEQAKMNLREEKQVPIQNQKEQLRQEEEEEIQMLHQQKEDALRSLKTELEKARQEEELRLREESQDELQKLQTQIHSETEAEKERIRLTQAAVLHRHREELESFQRSEEDQLEKQKLFSLEKIKKEAEAVWQAERTELEQESKRALSTLREKLGREKEAAMQELEMQFAVEIQQHKSGAEEEHRKVVSAFQAWIAEAQRREEAELQKELEGAEQKVQQKRHQVLEYERELSDLLKEKRQEVEREHAKQMEKVQEAHREVLAGMQAQHEAEEREQRAEMSASLQVEQERLRRLHQAELEAIQKQQLEQLEHWQEQERKAQHTALELDLRAKDAQARAAQLHAQEEAWRKKRQQLLEEEKQLDQEREEAALAARLCLEEARKEQKDLAEATRQLRGALGKLQGQKTELESQVERLQLQSQQLLQRVSDLEEAMKNKQELLKKLEEESPGGKEEALRVEDLQESRLAPPSREMASETPKSNEESSLLLDQVRHYISAEGASLKTAKEFLVRQTRSMRKRQTALRAAKQHWRHDLQRAHEATQEPGRSQVLEGVRRNLEEEGRQLDEMKSAMQRGQALLKKKAERLSQLESSLLDELSDEDTLRGAACKKVVTFDLSDSDDASSMTSSAESPHKVDLKPDLQFPPLDKIQYLTDSLQRITSDLNSVLGLLSHFSNQQPLLFASTQGQASPGSREGIPLATYTSLARVRSAAPFVPSAGPQWAWGPSSSPSPSALASQSVDSMLMEKWHKYFPGGFPLPCRSPGPTDSKLSYMTSGEQIRLFQRPHTQGPATERPNIQGMIDANKKWLESVKQESKVPLLPVAPKSSASGSGFVQLGLDENNQIKVYHF